MFNTADVVTVLLLLFIAMVVIQIFLHFFMIEVLHDKPIYMQWFILRGMTAIFHAAVFQVMDLWQWLPIVCWQLLCHFILFNPGLNKIRSIKRDARGESHNFHFWYLGSDSGWLDRLFLKDPDFYRLFYFGCCVLFVVNTILLYNLYV